MVGVCIEPVIAQLMITLFAIGAFLPFGFRRQPDRLAAS
jgi:hypothetical protein